jgi:hypothetical protein
MADRYWVGGTGTWDSSTTTHWATSSGGAGGASAPVAADNVIFDGSSGGGTVTTDSSIAAVAFGTLTCGAFTGTLTFNNHNTSFATFNGSGTGTRTINMGSGTMTLTATGAFTSVINFATSTNLTFNKDTSKISFTGVSTSIRLYYFGGLTYHNIEFAPPSLSTGLIDIGSSLTCTGAFTASNVTYLNFNQVTLTTTGSGTSTITGQANSPCLVVSGNGTATFSLAQADTWNYVHLFNIAEGGAGSLTVNNSYSSPLSPSGITVNNPSSGGGSQRVICG